MEKKMTKKEKFERVIEVLRGVEIEDREDLIECMEHEIELLSKKRTSTTKTQKENAEVAEFIYNQMVENNREEGFTVSDILNIDEVRNFKLESGKPLTTSKVTALLKILKENGSVENEDRKGKSIYLVSTVE